MNASLREIVLAVRFGEASLVGESVGYLILGACDRAVAVPRVVDLDGVLVTGEGEVVLDAAPVSEEEAERCLRALLGQLLTLLRAPFPNLARVAERAPCGLSHLVSELEAALVPVNRRAARRSLSRLVREARKSSAREHQSLAVTELDLNPVPAPAASVPPAPNQAVVPEPTWTATPAFGPTLDEVPSLLFEPVTQVPVRAEPQSDGQSDFEFFELPVDIEPEPSTWGEAPVRSEEVPIFGEPIDDAIDDAFDRALTRVASAVETLPPPETRQRPSFNLRRLSAAPEVEGPLISSLAPHAVRPSTIEDLLLCMRVEGEPTEALFVGLAQLARLDVSPLAPPVG